MLSQRVARFDRLGPSEAPLDRLARTTSIGLVDQRKSAKSPVVAGVGSCGEARVEERVICCLAAAAALNQVVTDLPTRLFDVLPVRVGVVIQGDWSRACRPGLAWRISSDATPRITPGAAGEVAAVCRASRRLSTYKSGRRPSPYSERPSLRSLGGEGTSARLERPCYM